MAYNELLQRGTADFPIELYEINERHPRYEMVAHWHSEFEMIRVTDGNLNVWLNNNTYTAKQNDIVFVNPDSVHAATADKCTYECVVFDISHLSAAFDGCRYFFDGLLDGEYRISEYIPCGSSAISESVNNVFEAMKRKSSGCKFKITGEIYKMFGEIIDLRLYSHMGGKSDITADKNVLKLKNALIYMRGNYELPLTLDDMAHAAGMSSKYFCAFFKQMTRKTPLEYLNTYRIEKAARRLIQSEESVTDIAYGCGFNDLSYFIKTFKKYKKVTPSKFRRNRDVV